MTAADKRVEELLDRWMASLELHARYLKLDDEAYARVENWPKHQRPTRWVIDLARKRIVELRAQLTQRRDAGDASFSDALELMAFLTSLLASEHIERFIPLATGKPPDTGASATVLQPRIPRAKPRAATSQSGVHRSGVHRQRTAGGATPRAAAPAVASPARSTAAATPRASASASSTRSSTSATAASGKPDSKSTQVIADAVRLLGWGREWPALAGLIASMADRPSEAEVWKILRSHRDEILAKAQRQGS